VSYLFISHDLAVVRQVSDRIGVLYDGELVELKTAEEIFSRPEHPYTRSLVDSALALRRSPAGDRGITTARTAGTADRWPPYPASGPRSRQRPASDASSRGLSGDASSGGPGVR
jgi:peptide/nickel transport system ATP-binding protein